MNAPIATTPTPATTFSACGLTNFSMTWPAATPIAAATTSAPAEAIDDLLWAFDDDAYIPHQVAGQDDEDELAPVLIAAPGTDAPLRPLLINLRDEAPAGDFDRVLEVVPADPAARAPLRERWKHYQSRGFALDKHDM